MSAGIKANNDGSAAIQVGGSDFIQIGATGNVTIPQNQTVSGTMTVTGVLNAPGGISSPSLGGGYVVQQYTSPTTWTKAAGLKGVRVTVIGAGGNGGAVNFPTPASVGAGGGGGGGGAQDFIPAPSIPGPQPITAGPVSASSFGAFVTATSGATASTVTTTPYVSGGGAGGSGSGGVINAVGDAGNPAPASPGGPANASGAGGATGMFYGMPGAAARNTTGAGNAASPAYYGAGGGGAFKASMAPTFNFAGGAGMPGIVIVEEFY